MAKPSKGASAAPPKRKRLAANKAAGKSAERATTAKSAASRLHAEAMRQAECAAMLIAVTRLLLNMRGRDYATWLRSVADDFEATDPELEHPDDGSDDLIAIAERDRSREGARPDEDSEPAPRGGGAADQRRTH